MDRAHSWADGRGAPRRPAQHWDGDDAPSSGGPCNASCLLEGPYSVTHGSGGMSTPQGDRAVPCVLRWDHAVASWALGGGCGMPLSSERCVRIQTQQGAGQGAGLHFPSHPGNKPCSNPAARVAVSLRAQGDLGGGGERGRDPALAGGCLQAAAKPSASCPALPVPACPCLSPPGCPALQGLNASAPAGTPGRRMGTPKCRARTPKRRVGTPKCRVGTP